ncbi:methyltransferase domain-containing protein [Patescibacteria group bacterium]|nr:methyltransferase domain-containing protein [Patescibacteria group bacterium]MBU4458371.1 methyltransferase domain-containing protein [Patescibacteria group bacterium]MCG2695874.1 class I SAM-dependent methyltransferase [Candidatus Portnoybacteria bacterium]
MVSIFEKLKPDVIVCPFCKELLIKKEKFLFCLKCNKEYPIINNVPYFLIESNKSEYSLSSRNFEFRSRIRNSRIFKILKYIFGADFVPYDPLKKFHSIFLGTKDDRFIVLNLGSGSKNYGRRVVNLDVEAFPNIDIVADGCCLPFAADTFDAVIAEAVIEHVKYPDKFTAEIKRVLKKGGAIFIVAPFVHPFHSYPNDYQRYSIEGLRVLFEDFKEIESGVYRGPSVAFIGIFSDYLAGIFSFLCHPIHLLMKSIFTILIFPIKFLDIILAKGKKSYILAHSVYYIGKKVNE